MADFKIFEKPTAETPPLGRFVLLDDGSGNYTKATLQSIIDQVPQQTVTGDGYVNNFTFDEASKTLSITQEGASNFSQELTGVAMQSELSTPTQRNNWDTAFSWGNHASAGYLTAESDPVFNNSAASNISSDDINNWNNKVGIRLETEFLDQSAVLAVDDTIYNLLSSSTPQLKAGTYLVFFQATFQANNATLRYRAYFEADNNIFAETSPASYYANPEHKKTHLSGFVAVSASENEAIPFAIKVRRLTDDVSLGGTAENLTVSNIKLVLFEI